MNLRATEAEEIREPRGGPMKFTYTSGSRPLDGYTIKRGIGRGGFGEVYYAVSDAGKEVALKLIRRNLDVELRGVTHCLNLRHPHLLALYDIKVDDQDDTWVVMEYVRGEQLEDCVTRHPEGLPLDEALAWIHGVGAGVAYLHDQGIVHRDLKPGNVFNDDGIVKIGDYGLSKFISSSRRSGQTESVGTVHYMAPEVANGRYGKEIDIYALGVMLYEVLTGRVPFDGESVGEVLMKHLTAQPDLSRLAEPYRTVVASALEKDPAKRAQSVAELLARLPQPASAPRVFTAVASALSPRPAAETAMYDRPTPAPFMAVAGHGETAYAGAIPPAASPAARHAPTMHVDERDPIARGLGRVWTDLRTGWQDLNLPIWARVLCYVLGSIMLVATMGLWAPLLILSLLIYCIYAVVLSAISPNPPRLPATAELHHPDVSPSPPPPPVPPLSPGAQAAAQVRREEFRKYSRRVRGESQAVAFLPLSARDRFTELTGSMLGGAAAASAISLLLLLMTGSLRPDLFAWLAIVSTIGTWGIQIAAKSWEGTRVEVLPRRFVLLVVGLALGTVAYGVHSALLIDLPYSTTTDIIAPQHGPLSASESANTIRESLFDEQGAPRLTAYLAYFGLLFPVLRWWELADPQRRTRLQLWNAFGCGLWAFVLSLFWQFPSGAGMAVAFTIACSVQLASPWVNRRLRRAQRST
ncbi:MAG: serine/threonine protein kinase [Pirellulales bacterium]|nr:serine/threonine protein kinase [Pirellulales bacterium]